MYLWLKPHFMSGIREGGFSGFAIHPDAARAGRRGYAILYTVHTERAGSPVWDKDAKVFKSPSGKVHHVSVLTEWRFNSPGFHETSLARRRELMRFEQPDEDHEVGQIAFNPTAKPGDADYGTLYVGVGDGGNTQQPLVEPFRVAQRLDRRSARYSGSDRRQGSAHAISCLATTRSSAGRQRCRKFGHMVFATRSASAGI